jgi:predicted DNA-binding helix-hairpin-helix protein
MDLWQKVDLLGGAAQWDTERGCSKSGRQRDALDRWIYPAIRPDGQRIRMLKVLQSNVCENNCAYCAFRRDRDVPRSAFRPDELAALFDGLVRQRRAEGLFLSSGICDNPVRSAERMLATVELVRKRYGFGGYIHLKVLPGSDLGSIEQSVRLATRVSVNLEAPNQERIHALSHDKSFDDLMRCLVATDQARRQAGRQVSMSTQFVVGASGESDQELLQTSDQLYRDLNLARAYYSSFQPIVHTPLEGREASPPLREHRLYQADFLLRQYGFGLKELVFDAAGNLLKEGDPKQVWAQSHPEFFPIEINRAETRELVRIPGIGPKSAAKIVARRRQGRLCSLDHAGLRGDLARRAAPFVLLDGRRPTYQPELWQAALAS